MIETQELLLELTLIKTLVITVSGNHNTSTYNNIWYNRKFKKNITQCYRTVSQECVCKVQTHIGALLDKNSEQNQSYNSHRSTAIIVETFMHKTKEKEPNMTDK